MNSADLGYEPFRLDTWERLFLIWTAGLTSGILGGMYGVGGPVLALFATHYNISSLECRSSFMIPFGMETFVRSIYIFFIQTTDPSVHDVFYLYITLIGGLACFVGLQIGNAFAKKYLGPRLFQILLLVVLVSGAVMISITGLAVVTSVLIASSSFLFFGLFACFVYYRVWKYATKYFCESKAISSSDCTSTSSIESSRSSSTRFSVDVRNIYPHK